MHTLVLPFDSCVAVLTIPGGLFSLIAWLVVATALLVLGIALVWSGRRRLLAWIERRALDWTREIGSHRLRLLGVRQIRLNARILVRLLSLALVMVGVFLWVAFVLELFDGTRAWGDHLIQGVLGELRLIAGKVVTALPGLGVVAILYFLTRVVHDVLNNYFRSIEDGEIASERFDAVTAEVTRRLAGVGLWVAAVIIAYPYIPGSETAAFKGVTILAGLMVSLGSTNLVGQLVNGLVLIYTRAVRPGDFVQTPQGDGTVERIGLFSCTLRTGDGVVITLPNSTLAQEIRNFSRGQPGAPACFFTTVTIGYDAPWTQVRDLLLAAARDVPAIRPDPAPWVRQAALEDFYVRYELVFAAVDPTQRSRTFSVLHEAIQNRFHAAGVQIMSPHYENDPATAKIPRVP
ncbi:Small-conductance mechanosensitive channel [Lacunisphaera limnophila]|uniref:Small-conductance mechanosensitive channel n=1 Tax=Lacunisphaera limnophila TaxID=1838286 RepID=A0A1D8ARY3_9BACT|nr:mechanosensitive ion channel domain-containing protein [Lacunisphaera limnophila]AOS43637.1 Small-conductance mechanosensitive channel [Lacunisphaera limnophila]